MWVGYVTIMLGVTKRCKGSAEETRLTPDELVRIYFTCVSFETHTPHAAGHDWLV